MDNSVKMKFYGAKVQITEGGAVFVEINGTTVYFENGSAGLCLNLWTNDMSLGAEIDLVECMEYSNNKPVK